MTADKRWFAWIPVLGERLLWPPSFSQKNKNAPSARQAKFENRLVGHSYSFCEKIFEKLSPQLNAGNYLFHVSTEGVGCTETIDDMGRFKTIRVLVFESNSDPDNFHNPKWAFIAQNIDGGEKYFINTLATITDFKRNGLYCFELQSTKTIPTLGKPGKGHPASEIHRRIRDFFHQHIHNKSDTVVLPVSASDEDEITRTMWEDYFGGEIGIIGKRAISERVCHIRELKGDIPHALVTKTFEAITNYIGKCRYGKSFCSKFLNTPEYVTYLESANRLQEIFLGFFSDLTSFVTTQAAKDAFVKSNESISIAQTAAADSSKSAKKALKWAAISALACCLTFVFAVTAYIWDKRESRLHDKREARQGFTSGENKLVPAKSLQVEKMQAATTSPKKVPSKPSGDVKKSEVKKPEVKIPASQPAEKPAATISSTD